MPQRDTMTYDVVIVGAGPAGLSAAIRLKQLAQTAQKELSVCIVEKGSEVGAHILSGAVLEPRALTELIPNWRELNSPVKTLIKEDEFLFLTETKCIPLPTPPTMQNEGNYIISLGLFCRFLAQYAENLGVEIYPGIPATAVLYDDHQQVIGIQTGDMGIGKDGKPTANYQPGMELHAKQTIFAEGCRGSLTKTLFEKFNLRDGVDSQTYAIGIKEVWQLAPEKHHLGTVTHTIGWPLENNVYGGSFIYHSENNKISIGFVIGLDYRNPYLSPFQEMQRFKLHPSIKPLLEGGQRIAYGARALSEGGFQSLPKLTFPGGLIVGDAAGFLNVPKIKGNHTAMKSGMIAAESIFETLTSKTPDTPLEIKTYAEALKQSWLWSELYKARNIRPAFRWGLWPGLIYAAFDTYLLRGRAPWTLRNHADYNTLTPANITKPIEYPKPDGQITFDRLSSVFLTNTFHEENQTCHLQLKDPSLAISINYEKYHSPEQYYCPAGVYEITEKDNKPYLQINAQNCIHCKTCDIKDPMQNINWVPPEGGGGPNYSEM
ncbi:MAG: electron transfer flavoprotein-ubiquinone oxidoreductase [Gammaproteobacteria bacterium]